MADEALAQVTGTRAADFPTITIPLTISELQNLALAAFMVLMCFAVWWVTKPRQSAEVKDHLKDRQWLIIPGLLWICLLIILLAALLAIVWGIPEHLTRAQTAEASKNTTTYFFALTALTAVLAAVVALPFTVLRTYFMQQQTRTAEQSHITDQINKAVENLGATREVVEGDGKATQPNLEVRIGGLLALKRISKKNPGEHIQIMEILCAYIRENARAQVAAEVSFDEDGKLIGGARTLRDDLLTAFDIIDRRADALIQIENDKSFRLNFKYADFRGLNLSQRKLNNANMQNAEMQGADLSGAEMQGAHLRWAQMRGADLSVAQMQGADLSLARMQGAHLRWAKMQGAHLSRAQMQGADLRVAEMQGAHLSVAQMQGANLGAAQMQGADLSWAQMQGADLSGAKMQGAHLRWAKMQGADLSGAQMDADTSLSAAAFQGAALRDVDFTNVPISGEQLNEMFGDATVTLPGGNGVDSDTWPTHWAREVLGWDPDPEHSEFHQAWRAWQDEIGFDRETFTIKPPPK